MTGIFSESNKDELGKRLKDVLANGLLPLFRVYVELSKRADSYNYELSCSLEELTQSLKYNAVEIQCILEDLAMLNLISFKINEEENQWKIKLLIH